MTWWPGRAASLSRCFTRSWLAPAPSVVIISRRRNAGGSAAIAASTIAVWSAAVFDLAEPRRSIQASGSPPVLSHTASSG